MSANALVWDGRPGHYEVYYLTLTDPATGVGFWIRYTMVAPLPATGAPATASLWFLAMDPRPGRVPTFGRKTSAPAAELHASDDPFELSIGDAVLSGTTMRGAVPDAAWELRFRSAGRSYQHVRPVLQRAGVAQTVLTLPEADLAVEGMITVGEERFELAGAHGGQAHLWGSKHARSWAWVHAGDFRGADGAPVRGAVLDGVSVFVNRFGREVGPSTPVVGRLEDEDFISTSPVHVLTNPSRFGLTGWQFEARSGARRIVAEVDAPRATLAGVTYHDPDGELAYCYNSEVATMRVHVLHRARRVGGWQHRQTLTAPGTAHFEYAQRAPLAGLELLTA